MKHFLFTLLICLWCNLVLAANITLHLQDTDIGAALQTLGNVAGTNIVWTTV